MSLNDCAVVEIIAKSVYIRFGYMARSVLSVLGIIAMAVLCKIRCNYMHFHPNARLLLRTYILWNLLLSISLLIMNATNVIRFSTQQSDWCNYLIQVKIGYPIRALSLIAIFGIELTMLSLCIERAIAVFAYRKYEKSTSKKLAYVMIIFQIIGSIWSTIGLNITVTDFEARTTLIQLRTSTNSDQVKEWDFF
ncbi:unnamed protein product [Toxocara canis]|uniref:G_PROTEIN_RECEP_F1_2 domain-containing protein n=1 Tax=Toxocara canis TaxID=6265 RepID=A0A183VBL9_TOXCA|nr:unnamed protein product [Toxocara canis]